VEDCNRVTARFNEEIIMTRKSLYVAVGAALAMFALSATAATENDRLIQQLSLSDGGDDSSTGGPGAAGPAGRAAESMDLRVDKDFESARGLSDGGPTPLPE
jgi:hypothetical protein